MHPSIGRTLVSPVLLMIGLLGAAATSAADLTPMAPSHVEWVPAPADQGCGAPQLPVRLLATERAGEPLGVSSTEAYPTFAWPLGRQMHDGLVVVNYVDIDQSTAFHNYMGGTATYEDHGGTDFNLFNFRMMDRGCMVRAAAGGTVVQVTTPTPYDRNCSFVWPVAVNSITIDTGGATYTDYYHLRANSTTVKVGDVVQTGQLLALVGSSGSSNCPHLHFQVWDNIGGQSHIRDPYSGPSNPLPSLWIQQDDYDADNPLWFTDLGVFSEAEVGGNVANTSYCQMIERLQQPVVYGIGEAKLPVFAQFQTRAGDPGRIEVRRPDGTIFGAYDFTATTAAQLGWFWSSWAWSGNVSAADYGIWTVRALSNGALSYSTSFQVGPATVFGPRFWRRGGRSFRVDGTVQRDTLRRSPLGGPVTYALLNAPSFVSLVSDSIVTVAAVSSQTTRSIFFQAVMTDGAARRDTAWFHVVDMSKAVGSTVDAGPSVTPAGVEFSLAGASPFKDGTALRYRLETTSRVWLAIHDLNGRLVRTLAAGEEVTAGQSVTRRWDGRDRDGAAAPGGIYFARLEAGGVRRVVKVARLP